LGLSLEDIDIILSQANETLLDIAFNEGDPEIIDLAFGNAKPSLLLKALQNSSPENLRVFLNFKSSTQTVLEEQDANAEMSIETTTVVNQNGTGDPDSV